MPEEPIKFRCARCRRLLGASRSKVGTVVHCPKCRAELIVPDPVADAGRGPDDSGDDTELTPRFPTPTPDPDSGLVVGSSAPSIRTGPADVGSAFAFLKAEEPAPLREAPPPRRARDPEAAPSFLSIGAPTVAPEPARRVAPDPAPRTLPPTATPPPSEVPTQAIEPPSPEPLTFPAIQVRSEPLRDEPPHLIPPVRVEPPTRLSATAPVARRNDVTLPRTTVVLWSFTMLLAVAFAFAAGLLAGHFLWTDRRGEAVGPPPAARAGEKA